MQKNIQLQVPKPCHENWGKMDPTDKGRFCLSCQKEVIDFSIMSDQQILQQISKASAGFCGKFNYEQLNRDIKENRKPRLTWYKYFVHVSIPALLLSNKLAAQTKTIGDTITCVTPRSSNAIVGKIKTDAIQSAEPFVINGKVVDEKGDALGGTSISIKGSLVHAVANSNGDFSISYSKKASKITLKITSVGFVDQELAIDVTSIQTIKVVLKENKMRLEEVLAGGLVVVTRKKRKPILEQIKDTVANICYKESIKVYPNPIHFGSNLNIDFDVKEIGEYNILVNNISGQPIMQKRIMLTSKNHSEQIGLTENFSNGLYFVTVQNISSKKIFSSKILIN